MLKTGATLLIFQIYITVIDILYQYIEINFKIYTNIMKLYKHYITIIELCVYIYIYIYIYNIYNI